MPRRILQGRVVSDKGDKTVVVNIERVYLHPLLKKTVRRSKRYHAHDEANAHSVGDVVRIRECPPHSKLKRWEIFAGDGSGAENAPMSRGKGKAAVDIRDEAENAATVGKGKVEQPADASESSRPADTAPQSDDAEAHAPGANA